ncbi:hypothetical protein [Paractinoplanes durhamensis]|uniref:hypothetical protein n=1 Tax=Paractinoplanes durhamensis TaxID=113563 RepID=UPI00362CD4D1
MQHKLDVLKAHCDTVGRDYDEIEKTVMYRFDLEAQTVGQIVEDLGRLAAMGFTVGHGGLRNVYDTNQLEIFRKEIIPAVEAL